MFFGDETWRTCSTKAFNMRIIKVPYSERIWHLSHMAPWRNSSMQTLKKLLYADDLALVANGKQELQETLEEWNGLFTRHGLKINVEKTEVLHIGLQREELDIALEGKKLTHGDSFVYLGGAVCGDGKTEREVRRRVQAGANAWRAVEGVMADRRISKRLKGKVMSTCVTPACLYGTETLALTELQQQRLQVCENNWVRKIARVTRADRRRMVELREETGVQRSLTERLVRSRLQWAGHVERMADDRLPKRAAELREQGRRRRGRPRLRWEDCVKRDVRKAGEEEDWKKKTRDRGGWKRLSDEAVKKLRAAPHPWQRETRKRERYCSIWLRTIISENFANFWSINFKSASKIFICIKVPHAHGTPSIDIMTPTDRCFSNGHRLPRLTCLCINTRVIGKGNCDR